MERVAGQLPREKKQRRRVVWGSGFMFDGEVVSATHMHVTAVRGPLSAARLPRMHQRTIGALGDPALLVSRLFAEPLCFGTIPKASPLLIPHFMDLSSPYWWHMKTQWPEIEITDTLGDPFSLMHRIATSSLVISTGLHPLIVADAYGIPSIWIQVASNVKGGSFKFTDHSLSVGSTRRPVPVDSVIRAGRNAFDLATPPPDANVISAIQADLLVAYGSALENLT
mgnify:CR=1 FL=1